ncbi:2OG-Fe(II) oxygenase [Kangiella sp. HZ709]|uniref:2OG-Fe(II) oxygenase n=1 Tax=Kangiella sp. HZ709 TaxID=2666328 RepID=UPI0012B0C8A8|nr:2OG-Fe(II) oxygenase [Kangiella sp. HZ709]MRX26960.1 2OG-Fe(II) oxygenase [Kangiella sp. HZ709]
MKPVRTGSIQDRKIAIYDGLLKQNEVVALDRAFQNAPFTKNEVAKAETQNSPHWALNLSIEEFKSTPMYSNLLLALSDFTGDASNYHPYRHYCNYASFGDMLYSHRDSSEPGAEITALWFICTKWHHDWGGETLFYSDEGDAEFVCTPKPGRLVLFDSHLLHAGKAPNRNCLQPRFTFAVKLEKA